MNKKMMWGVFYLLSVLLGNLFVIWFGVIKLMAVEIHNPDEVFNLITFPAGVVWIGLTFSFRDFAQRHWGKTKVWFWMLGALFVTLFLNWKIALASGAAFLIAETIDWALFSFVNMTFRKRLILSNVISTPIDSAAFVTLAFGWYWPAIWGQAVIKFASSLIVLLFIKDEGINDHQNND